MGWLRACYQLLTLSVTDEKLNFFIYNGIKCHLLTVPNKILESKDKTIIEQRYLHLHIVPSV